MHFSAELAIEERSDPCFAARWDGDHPMGYPDLYGRCSARDGTDFCESEPIAMSRPLGLPQPGTWVAVARKV